MNYSKYDAVVFDCDGVMFDTTKANTAYYNHILEHFGKPGMTPDQFAYTHMHTVDESLAHLFNDETERAAAFAFRSQMSYLPFLQFMKIEPDLISLLAFLRPEVRTAIATNRSDTMQRVLHSNGLTDAFDLVVTALDVVKPKPYPDQLNKILSYFKLKPEQAVYIGDSELDAAAAGAAGMPFAAFANRKLDAQYHISRLRQVKDILDGTVTGSSCRRQAE
jgi:HAD superfamily hydrolase (TIGR01509 family)